MNQEITTPFRGCGECGNFQPVAECWGRCTAVVPVPVLADVKEDHQIHESFASRCEAFR